MAYQKQLASSTQIDKPQENPKNENSDQQIVPKNPWKQIKSPITEKTAKDISTLAIDPQKHENNHKIPSLSNKVSSATSIDKSEIDSSKSTFINNNTLSNKNGCTPLSAKMNLQPKNSNPTDHCQMNSKQEMLTKSSTNGNSHEKINNSVSKLHNKLPNQSLETKKSIPKTEIKSNLLLTRLSLTAPEFIPKTKLNVVSSVENISSMNNSNFSNTAKEINANNANSFQHIQSQTISSLSNQQWIPSNLSSATANNYVPTNINPTTEAINQLSYSAEPSFGVNMMSYPISQNIPMLCNLCIMGSHDPNICWYNNVYYPQIMRNLENKRMNAPTKDYISSKPK